MEHEGPASLRFTSGLSAGFHRAASLWERYAPLFSARYNRIILPGFPVVKGNLPLCHNLRKARAKRHWKHSRISLFLAKLPHSVYNAGRSITADLGGMDMKFTGNMLRLYAVTDRSWLKPGETLMQQVEQALLGGVTMVQLREKELSRERFLEEAKELLPLCHRFGVPLIINDDAQLALEAGADGVHIGQDDMAYEQARALLGPEKIIGVSAHNPREALAAQEAGAD